MNQSMHILIAASEASPLARSSYMGDVVSALPVALSKKGISTALVIPRYSVIPSGFEQEKILSGMTTHLGENLVNFDVYRTHFNDIPVYLIDQPDYYYRDGMYRSDDGDYPDNAERFIFFARAIIDLLPFYPQKPTIIHCNDWQTGLAPLYLKLFKETQPEFQDVKSLFTVHNMAYQGLFWRFDMHLTGLPWDYFSPDGIEFYGDLNLLKAGLLYSDAINTVSPRYCREIQTEEHGCGLDGVLRTMQGKLHGILNGADYCKWSPENCSELKKNYSLKDLSGKNSCKEELLDIADLDTAGDMPLLSMISPLYSRKGVDLLELALPQFIQMGFQVILQGKGDKYYVKLFQELAEKHSEHFTFFNNFDQLFSQKILSGSDMLIKPSRFEPCGLNQMYALRFGTIPIVHRTGGLDDTITDSTETKTQTGFKFNNYDLKSILKAAQRAYSVYQEKDSWNKLIHSAMSMDYSWNRSASQYIDLYRSISGLDGK